MIERKIIIACITQTEYLRQIESEWSYDYIESTTARTIATWCWEYFAKYRKAPNRDIELIYIKKIKKGFDKSLAEEIEEILADLSTEYENEEASITYIVEETLAYFKERQVILHSETLNALLSKNKIEDALKLSQDFKLKIAEKGEDEVDLSNNEILSKVESAFDTTYQNVISFPGALGEFWNEQLVRGGLVSLLAPEKRGKTYWLLEFMMRAFLQKRKVAFFQAGDMTESQLIVRIGIYLAKKSNQEKYCGIKYIPIQDCVKNQTDTCTKKVRECDFGVFDKPEKDLRDNITFEELIETYEYNKNYSPCYNCTEWVKNKWGAVWLCKRDIKNPLTAKGAKLHYERFFIKERRPIKISSHVNGTLKVSKIKAILKKWKDENEFVPDVICIDYADLLEPENKRQEFRHQQNQIWKDLRALSQENNCLVLTATQSDADSYGTNRLGLGNFSEDKRKFAHVTAMYGLNQDTSGREKQIGIMRINKIVIREGDFHTSQEVNVLQRLEIGRPFLGSFL